MGLLTDEEIEAIAKPFMSMAGDYWCNENAIRENGGVDSFAQAIETAVLKKLAGVAGEPVAWVCCVPGQEVVLLFVEPSDERYPPKFKDHLYTLPGAAALQQQLAQKDAGIERRVGAIAVDRTYWREQAVELQSRVAELERAAKYAEHIDAMPENQRETMLHDALTERNALRVEVEVLKAARVQVST